jgi:hypothetical protein
MKRRTTRSILGSLVPFAALGLAGLLGALPLMVVAGCGGSTPASKTEADVDE